jgi:hypothetical protein
MCENTKYLSAGEVVTVVVSRTGSSTTGTFADGTVLTATSAGNPATPGVATGGDVNYSGSAAAVAGLGPGGGAAGTRAAPAGSQGTLDFPGAKGGPGNGAFVTSKGGEPGAGSGNEASTLDEIAGADGRVVTYFVRD